MIDPGARGGAQVGEGVGRVTAELYLHFAGYADGGSLCGEPVRPRHTREASGGDTRMLRYGPFLKLYTWGYADGQGRRCWIPAKFANVTEKGRR